VLDNYEDEKKLEVLIRNKNEIAKPKE